LERFRRTAQEAVKRTHTDAHFWPMLNAFLLKTGKQCANLGMSLNKNYMNPTLLRNTAEVSISYPYWIPKKINTRKETGHNKLIAMLAGSIPLTILQNSLEMQVLQKRPYKGQLILIHNGPKYLEGNLD